MLKNLISFIILACSLINLTAEEQKYTLACSDSITFEVPQEDLEHSSTITNMLQDCFQSDIEIPVSKTSLELQPLLPYLKALSNRDIDLIKQSIRKLSLGKLIELYNLEQFFDIKQLEIEPNVFFNFRKAITLAIGKKLQDPKLLAVCEKNSNYFSRLIESLPLLTSKDLFEDSEHEAIIYDLWQPKSQTLRFKTTSMTLAAISNDQKLFASTDWINNSAHKNLVLHTRDTVLDSIAIGNFDITQTTIKFSCDNTKLIIYNLNSVKIVSIDNKKLSLQFTKAIDLTKILSVAALSPDNKTLFVLLDTKEITAYNLVSSTKKTWSINEPNLHLQFGAIKCCNDKLISLYSSRAGTNIRVQTFNGTIATNIMLNEKMRSSIIFSDDGSKVAAIAESLRETHIKVWDVATGKELFCTRAKTSDFTMSPDGKRLVAHICENRQNRLEIFDINSNACIKTIPVKAIDNWLIQCPDLIGLTAEITDKMPSAIIMNYTYPWHLETFDLPQCKTLDLEQTILLNNIYRAAKADIKLNLTSKDHLIFNTFPENYKYILRPYTQLYCYELGLEAIGSSLSSTKKHAISGFNNLMTKQRNLNSFLIERPQLRGFVLRSIGLGQIIGSFALAYRFYKKS